MRRRIQLPHPKGMRIVTDLIMDVATKNSRYVRVVESTRASQCQTFQPDVGRAVFVSASSVAAGFANKVVSRLSVCLFRVAALTALAGRVARVNPQERNTGNLRLVVEHPAQLGKRPAMQLRPLAFSSPDPRTNTSEFFNGNHSIRAFCERNYASRNCVVRVFGEPLLFAAALFQQALGRLRADTLKLAAKSAVAMANLIEFCAAVFIPVRVGANVDNSHVHAKHVNGFNLFFFRHFNSDVQKPFSVAENQIRFTTRIGKQCSLPFATDKGHLGATLNRPDAHGGRNQIQRKDSGVVRNTAVLTKHAFNFLVEFVGIGNLRVEQADNLRRQRELVSDLAIETLVKRKPAKLLRCPSQLREAVGGGICSLQSLAQGVRLFWRRLQFNLDSQFQLGQYTSNI